MTTVSEPRVGASLLYVAIDLGVRPEMLQFGQQVNHVVALWRYCLHLSAVANDPELRLYRFERIEGSTASQDEPWSDIAAVHVPAGGGWSIIDTNRRNLKLIDQAAPLLISRTSLASPWASMLTTVAEKSAPIAYGMAALFAMQRLLDMIITWQRHRLDLRQRSSDTPQSADQLLVEHGSDELTIHQGRPRRDPRVGPTVSLRENSTASTAVEGLAPVLEAKMVDENDPSA